MRTSYLSYESEEDTPIDHTDKPIKCLLLGSKKVGKTSLIERLTRKYFTLYYKATKNIEIHREVEIANMKLTFWDIPAHIKYHFKLDSLKAEVVLLMYDTMRPETKDQVLERWEMIHKNMEQLPYVFLVGVRTPRDTVIGTHYIDNMTGEGIGKLMYNIQKVCQT